MKKFLVLMSASVAFAFASCATAKSDHCGACKGGDGAKTECASSAKDAKTCPSKKK